MKLIVGLGNPGEKYAGNRHNVGFMALDRIFADYGFQPWRRRFSGDASEGRIGAEKCLLLKPLTYMNESGRSAAEAMRFFRIELDDVVVIHDEIDLEPGRLKVKSGGGNAGHNGLGSLSSHIGNDYQRIRIGVGRPADKSQVANYVLRDFAKSEEEWLQPLLKALTDAMPAFVDKGSAAFSAEVARVLGPEKPKAPKRKDDEASSSGEALSGERAPGSRTSGGSPVRNSAAGAANPFVEKLKHLLQSKKDEG